VHGILSKNNRVLALIGALAAGSFVVGGIVYAVSSDQAGELAAMSTRISRLDALANTMSTEVNHAEDSLGDYVLSGDAIARKGFDDAVTNQAAAADDFRAVAAGMEPVESALARLEVASLDWRDRIAMPAIRGVKAGTPRPSTRSGHSPPQTGWASTARLGALTASSLDSMPPSSSGGPRSEARRSSALSSVSAS